MAKQKQVEGQLSFADFLVAREEPVGEQTVESVPVGSDDDEAQFEAEFAKLTQFFDSVKTEEFDAMQYLSPIANAVKTAIEEQIPFADALASHCSKPSAEKILQAFTGEKQQKLFAIICGMHDDLP